MQIILINNTATLIDSKGNTHLNSDLSKNDVLKISKIILDYQNAKTDKKKASLEEDILRIVSPDFIKNSKKAESLKIEVDKENKKNLEIKETFTSNKEFNKHFSHGPEGVFYKGFKNTENVTLPDELLKHIEKIISSQESILPYVKFWELALANPDKNAREGLFKFVKKQKLIITPNGYIVCYRRAKIIEGEIDPKLEFILKEITRLRSQRGSLTKYSFAETKAKKGEEKTFVTLDHRTKKFKEWKGNKPKLYSDLAKKYENSQDENIILTDNHTGKMRFGLGSVVSIPRENCDASPNVDCSYGLHIGSRNYVSGNAYFGAANLMCLVNPSKVVAVPYSDAHKMRVCEYKIVSMYKNFSELEKFEDTDIQVMEHDYIDYEVKEIKNLLKDKKFDKENYSQNAEIFLRYAKSMEENKVIKSKLSVSKKELEAMRRNIKRKK